jgi:hypothetical protein
VIVQETQQRSLELVKSTTDSAGAFIVVLAGVGGSVVKVLEYYDKEKTDSTASKPEQSYFLISSIQCTTGEAKLVNMKRSSLMTGTRTLPYL